MSTRYFHESPWKRTVLALLLFGTAFGYLEAAVVSYLRLLHEPALSASRQPSETPLSPCWSGLFWSNSLHTKPKPNG